MHLEAHAGLGWILGTVPRGSDRRLRNSCVVAAIIADVDAVALLWGREAYDRWHHTFGHNIFLGLLVVGAGCGVRAPHGWSGGMTTLLQTLRESLLDGVRRFGVARWIIVGFLALVWLIAALGTDLSLGTLMGDCLVRSGMNGLLVLALVLPVRAGHGLNFGIPLGIVCGLVGGIAVMELAAKHPYGLADLPSQPEIAYGWSGFALAHVLALPLAALAGWGYGWLLERVRGREMMVGIYVGFGAIAGMCVVWLLAPLTSEELIWPIGGHGVRNTIVLDSHYKWILDSALEIDFGTWAPAELDAQGNPPPFRRPEGFYIPTGLLLYWFGACALMSAFLRTRLGTAMTAAGENPHYARSVGIAVPRMRILSTIISTVLAAAGIIVYSQSYGFYQLYKAPLWMAFPTVAALLLGGASLRRATVYHVVIGTCLFQSLLTTSLPTVNDLVQSSPYADGLANLPEIARLVIQNGVILYALSRGTRNGAP
ncbi:ABC transporter permease [Planctomycetota bacterium]